MVRAFGMNPEEILTKEALQRPERAYTTPLSIEEDQVRRLTQALREQIKREVLDLRAEPETVSFRVQKP